MTYKNNGGVPRPGPPTLLPNGGQDGRRGPPTVGFLARLEQGPSPGGTGAAPGRRRVAVCGCLAILALFVGYGWMLLAPTKWTPIVDIHADMTEPENDRAQTRATARPTTSAARVNPDSSVAAGPATIIEDDRQTEPEVDNRTTDEPTPTASRPPADIGSKQSNKTANHAPAATNEYAIGKDYPDDRPATIRHRLKPIPEAALAESGRDSAQHDPDVVILELLIEHMEKRK